MNDLNLPPRRSMPADVRERLRDRLFTDERPGPLRAPFAVAAGVAILAAGAMIVSQSVAGTPPDYRPGTPTSTTSGTAAPPTVAPAPPLIARPPDARSGADLDRCGAVAAASPRAREFAPRSAWQPVYTVSRRGHRITAYREYGGKPGFCDVTATTATVSDPSAEPMSLGVEVESGSAPINVEALYLSEAGLLNGVVQGVPELGFAVVHDSVRRFAKPTPVHRDEVFTVDVGVLVDGDVLQVWAFDEAGNVAASGETIFDSEHARPAGATATDR